MVNQYDRTRLGLQRDRVRASQQAAQSLIREVNTNAVPVPVGARPVRSVDDVVDTLGLSARQRVTAREIISEIQSDSRNLLGLSRRALDAGLNRYQVAELFRRATELASISKAEAEMPVSMRVPSGFTPIPRGRKGGYRRLKSGGGYEYWYPGDQSPRSEPHDEDHFDVHEEHDKTTPKPAIRAAALQLRERAQAAGLDFNWNPTAKTTMKEVNEAEEYVDHAIARTEAIESLIVNEGLSSDEVDARIANLTTSQLRELVVPKQSGDVADDGDQDQDQSSDQPIGTTDDGLPYYAPGSDSDYQEAPRVSSDNDPTSDEFDESTGLPTDDQPPQHAEELRHLREQIATLQSALQQARSMLSESQQRELRQLETRGRRLHQHPRPGAIKRFALDVGRFLWLSLGMAVGSALGGPAGMLVGLWAAEQIRAYREARNIAPYDEPERPLFRRSLVFDLARDQVLWKAEATYKVPAGARGNAKKVLRWKEIHGDEVRGMTSVGWARARQLASQDTIGLDTVKRMSAFNRHRKNAEIASEYRDTPWRDAGYVAWLGWGGTTGIDWARRITGALDKSLTKAASHKYIKRIPTGNPKRPWQYVYRVQDAGGVIHDAHYQVGAAFRAAGGHYHVVEREGDTVTIKHDETGERRSLSTAELTSLLAHEHAAAISTHRAGLEDRLTKYKPGSYWHTRISEQLRVWDSLPKEQREHGWRDPKETLESPSFEAWFRKSKVVDDAGLAQNQYGGRPLTVYHGTPTGGFRSFSKDKDKGFNIFGKGFYFTADREIATEYTHKDEDDKLAGATGISRDGQPVRTLTRDQAAALLRASGFEAYDGGMFRWRANLQSNTGLQNYNVLHAVVDASDDNGNVDVQTLINRFWEPSKPGYLLHDPRPNPATHQATSFFRALSAAASATPDVPDGQVYEVFLSLQNPLDMDAPVSREDFARFAASTAERERRQAESEVSHIQTQIADTQRYLSSDGLSEEDSQYYRQSLARYQEQAGYAAARLDRIVAASKEPRLQGLYLDNLVNVRDATEPRGFEDLVQLKQDLRSRRKVDGTPAHGILHLTDDKTLTWGDLHWIASNGHQDPQFRTQFTEWAKSAGFDGIHHTGGWNIGTKAHSVWIAFEPNQIKATNSERFDGSTDDIFKSDPKRTPAKPHERVHGSDSNPEGSASSPDNSISLSDSVVSALKAKVRDHNEASDDKVTLGQLKAVYRRGSGAFSTSHHPNANRHSWSMGRVNSFLRRVKGGDGHSQDDDLISQKAEPKTVSDKIRLLMREGKPRAQAVAIALDMERRGELVKSERPSGSGWSMIPLGKRGGFRRRDGDGWEYWYPSGSESVPHILHHESRMNEAKAQAAAVRDAASQLPDGDPRRTRHESIAASFDRTAAEESKRVDAARDAAERKRSDSPGQAYRGKRTLGVDEGTVWSVVAEGLEAYLSPSATGGTNLPAPDPGGTNVIGPPPKVRVKTVTGVVKDIPIYFVRTPGQLDVDGHIESRSVASVSRDGRVNHDVTVSVPHQIVVKIPESPQVPPDKLLQSARHVVAHELAHATDNLTRAHKIRQADRGKKDYYNDPAEIVAYRHNMFRDLNTPEVAQDVTALLDKNSMSATQASDWREFQRLFGDHGDVSALGVDAGRPALKLDDVKTMLNRHSPTWKQVSPNLTPENRVRFLRTAAAVLTSHADGTSTPLAKADVDIHPDSR